MLAMSQSISQLGSLLTNFAVSWILISDEGSSGWLAAYLAYSVFLYAVFSLVAGRILDRWDRRKAIAISEFVAALTLGCLAVAEWFGVSGRVLYFGASFVAQLCGTLVMVGTQAVIGDFGAGSEAARVQSGFDVLRRTFTAGGPVLAGLLVAALPKWGVFALDSLTYLISMAGALLFIPVSAQPPAASPEPLRSKLLPKFTRAPGLDAMIGVAVGVNLVYAPVLILWPLLAKDLSGGPVLMGVLSGSFLAGSIAGGLWVMRDRSVDLWSRVNRALLLVAGAFILLAATSKLSAALLWCPAFMLGMGFGLVSGPIMGIIHMLLPINEKGAFFGWLGFVGQIGQPAAIALCGLIAMKAGSGAVLISAAGGALAAAFLFRKARRDQFQQMA